MYASSSRRRYFDLPLVEEDHAGEGRRARARELPCRPPRVLVGAIGVEGRELRLRALDELERRLGDDPERPLVAHEEVLELIAGGRLAHLPAAAVADPDDLAGREHDLEADDEIPRVAVAPADQRPAARPYPPADERARVRGRVVRIDEPERLQLLRELQHVDSGLDGDGPVLDVDLEDPVHELHVDEDPVPKRHRPVGESGPAGARNDGDAVAIRQLDDFGDLLGGGGKDDRLRNEVLPSVCRERRRDPRAVEERRATGEDMIFAADRDELVDQGVGKARNGHLIPRIRPLRRRARRCRRPRCLAPCPARSAAFPTRGTPRPECSRLPAPLPLRLAGG